MQAQHQLMAFLFAALRVSLVTPADNRRGL
jgi:hypothetical protein